MRPLSWKESPEKARPIFQAMRSKEGEELVFAANAFVEIILPSAVLPELTEEETVRSPTFVQEDFPRGIGEAVAAFIARTRR